VVKVVADNAMNAIYFSRAPIPHPRDNDFKPLPSLFRHIGVYVYRKAFLLEFLQWPEGILEAQEKLEQLRILERGYRIKLIKTEDFSPGVDTPADVERVEEWIKTRGMWP
jgi:3-deoxy-manno-octulosonate cytidylyltransferase (CMP-KDO synthetase)